MDEIPSQLLEGLSLIDGRAVAVWWSELADAARSEVATLWDARQDRYFFAAIPEDPSNRVPAVFGGHFVPSDDTTGWAEWHAECFDYLLRHPELVCFAPPVVRTFHICIQHEAARGSCWRKGEFRRNSDARWL